MLILIYNLTVKWLQRWDKLNKQDLVEYQEDRIKLNCANNYKDRFINMVLDFL